MSGKAIQNMFKLLPSVDEVMSLREVSSLEEQLERTALLELVREAIEEQRRLLRAEMKDDAPGGERRELSEEQMSQHLLEAVSSAVLRDAHSLLSSSLRRVVNATGIVIHTNLGRSPLADEAVAAVTEVARGYSTLEYDISRMKRGSRHDHVEKLICMLTGAEAAAVVNNNAAAVMMVLAEFAKGHEAVVSRGEQVEIGGSFRIPDIMAASGATMVEVGATNKTHLSDYANVVGPDTSLLLKVHSSNYRMLGFTESVSVAELRLLADEENSIRQREAKDEPKEALRARGNVPLGFEPLLVYEDQGSGALLRLDCFGEYEEPTVRQSIEEGCDIVSFSGDKLLGGAQAGIIVGKANLVARLKKNPLMRAMRPDKMTLAALEATLRLYLNPQRALEKVPTLRMLTESLEDIEARGARLLALIEDRVGEDEAICQLVQEVGHGGGGALPACDIETAAVRVSFTRGNAQGCELFLTNLNEVPIVARIKKDALLLDARTLVEEELEEVASGLRGYFDHLAAR